MHTAPQSVKTRENDQRRLLRPPKVAMAFLGGRRNYDWADSHVFPVRSVSFFAAVNLANVV